MVDGQSFILSQTSNFRTSQIFTTRGSKYSSSICFSISCFLSYSGFHKYRFPDDQYDRYWYAWELTGNDPYSNISTQSAIELNTTFMVPLRVLQTAFVPVGNSNELVLRSKRRDRLPGDHLVILHFADFQDNKTREFTVSIDSGVQSGPISPPYLKGWSIINWSSDSEDLSIKLVATATSALPPILNAYEVYSRIIHEYPMTFSQDCKLYLSLTMYTN